MTLINNRPFNYVCMRCLEKARPPGKPYEGVVHITVTPVTNDVWDLVHECFTCGTKWNDRLNITTQHVPKSKKEFFTEMKKRTTKRAD